uniref:Uncharacterized protein n=1 Tax=Spongospora subterranea TaxID=70186 RepID=A0A0H5RG54_9EUKA|eukprot:CRZ13003.1 hypothetical protein [Spongospora subterranea]
MNVQSCYSEWVGFPNKAFSLGSGGWKKTSIGQLDLLLGPSASKVLESHSRSAAHAPKQNLVVRYDILSFPNLRQLSGSFSEMVVFKWPHILIAFEETDYFPWCSL